LNDLSHLLTHTMTSTKKNFSIQAFRQKSDFDEATAKKLWNTLKVAITEIYNQNASSLSFEELYRNAYNLVLHRHSELLYGGVRDTIREQLVKSRDQICSTKNDELMQSMVRTWTFHTVAFNMMKDILMYMDKSYAITRKKPVVYTLALQLFRSVIIYDDTVRERLRTTLLQEILRERLGHVIDRSVLKAMLGMLQDLNIDGVHVYEEEFERYFLEDTVQFYRVESLEFLSRNTCQDYVAKAEARLREEDSRVHHYLSVSTEPKLRTSLEAELIAAHTPSLLSMELSGFTSMLRDDKVADLSKIYALFCRVPSSLEQMRDCLGRVVKGMGQDIIAQQQTHKDPVQFVKGILDLKEKFDVIIQQAFRAEKLMIKRLNGAFEAFINEGYHCASHLANYVDELLRGGAGIQVANELEIEDKLERVLVIFKFISDKDIFENYYRRLLSKRLLSGKTVSDELEKQMIAKLKAECGYQFTSKLEGMYLDMKISKSVQENFQSSAMYPSIGR
jgi:cullin 3